MSVDAINERLHGLVTLLQAVGVDSLGEADGSNKVSKGDISLPDTRQLNDDQIELIIKKLQLAQTEAPQLIQELQRHADARSIQGGDKKDAEKEEDDDDEEDDEFDEDANYPMVGGGCSDDISVVSDLTTPTVLQGSHVPEEEHYRETLPPMMIGGGGQAPSMMIHSSKKKNLVKPLSRSAIGVQPPHAGRRPMGSTTSTGSRPSVSVADKRRREYAEAMAKLQDVGSSDHSGGGTKPLRKTGTRSSAEKPKTRSSKPKTKKTGHSSLTDFGNASNRSTPDWATPSAQEQWAAFDSKPKTSTNIDNDGFLVGGSFDPFGTGSSGGFSSSAGDLAFGGPTSRSRRGEDSFGSQHSGDGHQTSSHSRSKPGRKQRPDKKPGAPERRTRQPRRASTIT